MIRIKQVTRNIPMTHTVYTFAEMAVMNLDDSPHLGFVLDEEEQAVQTAHVTKEQLLAIPGWAESKWRYIYTTHEFIPVFLFAEGQAIKTLVDVAPALDADGEPDADTPYLWVTPKGFPRDQH